MTINIGIAGSNNRETVVNIISMILRNANKKIKVLDNFTKHDIINLQNSSEYDFAIYNANAKTLESLEIGLQYNIGFDISALLNINQFDRESLNLTQNNEHNSGYYNHYENVLNKIFEGTRKYCVFNAMDPKVDFAVQNADVCEGVYAVGFSSRTPSRSQIGVVENEIIDRAFYSDNTNPLRFLEANHIVNLEDLDFVKTPVNTYYNWLIECVCASVCIVRAVGISIEIIKNTLKQFYLNNTQASLIYKRKLKFEPDYYFGEINYINDSYSTNIIDSKNNITSYNKNSVILICGGDTKLLDYSQYVNDIKEFLLACIIVGTSHSPIYSAFKNNAPNLPVYLVEPTYDLSWIKKSINMSEKLANENNTIIFSPAADISTLGDESEIKNEFTKIFNDIKERYSVFENSKIDV